MTKKQKIRMVLNLWRLIFVWLAYKTCPEKEKINMDIEAWNYVKGIEWQGSKAVSYYMLSYKEFRNLFFHRTNSCTILWLIKFLFPPLDLLFLACENIGGGLFIQHGFATIVAAKQIGDFCWINQQVTIGYKGESAPILGDRVKVYAGAIIIGGVTIEDDSVIGAGAVVTKDVESGCVVAGNPSKVIKRKKY